LQWAQEDEIDLATHRETIVNGLKEWLKDDTITAQSEPVQLKQSGEPSPTEAVIQHKNDADSIKVRIRNGVILALALTAGMALAFLGL